MPVEGLWSKKVFVCVMWTCTCLFSDLEASFDHTLCFQLTEKLPLIQERCTIDLGFPCLVATASDSGLAPGGIAGIVVGSVAALALVLLAGFLAYRRFQEHKVGDLTCPIVKYWLV